MEYKRYGSVIALRLDKGDDITESVYKIAEKEGVKAAKVSGIGATDNFTVGVFDIAKKEYEKFDFSGNHEINVLTGNITEKDGKPYIHLHITATGKDCKVVGGHLIKGVISLTGEIIITVISGEISREYDETLGINRWKF
ncbi:MAG: DNA-binding protein [Clostridia bacterium]|nr:DNA-binding protein [Clostridia bacterium]